MQTKLYIDGELTDGLAGRTIDVINPGSPFGGTGKSGYGREMGFAAMDEYTTRKSVWINVDATLPDWYAR
jgi:acyl-CoA reductase-like NAD-dependent aldehyde dehydrogenase